MPVFVVILIVRKFSATGSPAPSVLSNFSTKWFLKSGNFSGMSLHLRKSTIKTLPNYKKAGKTPRGGGGGEE